MPKRPERRERIGDAFRTILWIMLPVGLAIALVGTPVGAAAAEVEISDVTIEGNGVIEADEEVVLWHGASTTIAVDIGTGPREGAGHYDVCLSLSTEKADASRLGCTSQVLQGNRATTVTFNRNRWPADHGGRGTVRVTVRADTLAGEVVDRATRRVVLLDRGGDYDDDGLDNSREFEVGTAFDRADTDADGIVDGLELDPFSTDPTVPDTDSDGLDDGAEIDTYRTDPTAVDTDGDGLHDRVELRDHRTNPNRLDTDGDGLDDAAELNAHATDPRGPDTDGDGLDDGAEVKTHHTDPTDADTDDDGLTDALEVYTFSTSASAVDSDGDGLADGAEVHRFQTDPTTADTDRDGLDDGPEINDYGTDPNAIDTDGDGLHDGPEITRFGLDPTLVDSDGDGRPDGREVSRPLPDIDPVFVLIGIGALIVAGWWLRSRRGPSDGPATPTEPSDGPAAPAPAPPEASPTLTNEDRVMAILERHGGRLKQSRIVEETDWSKSTVSRVLSRMEEDGQITKISLGRGNLITLPGAEPERSRPPFEEHGPPSGPG